MVLWRRGVDARYMTLQQSTMIIRAQFSVLDAMVPSSVISLVFSGLRTFAVLSSTYVQYVVSEVWEFAPDPYRSTGDCVSMRSACDTLFYGILESSKSDSKTILQIGGGLNLKFSIWII
jgi:hypothetical protein